MTREDSIRPAYSVEAAIAIYKDRSLKETAAYFGVKPWRVRRDLLAQNIPMRKQGHQRTLEVAPPELITFLLEKHKSGRKAAQFRGVSRQTFQRWRNQSKHKG